MDWPSGSRTTFSRKNPLQLGKIYIKSKLHKKKESSGHQRVRIKGRDRSNCYYDAVFWSTGNISSVSLPAKDRAAGGFDRPLLSQLHQTQTFLQPSLYLLATTVDLLTV